MLHSVESDLCPVCGYRLGFAPWNGASASDEICPCCFIQFGYDDGSAEDENLRAQVYTEWRKRWIAEGMRWNSKGRKPPHEWDPIKQLRSIGVELR